MIRETNAYDKEDVLHLVACQDHEDQRYQGRNESFKDIYDGWRAKGLVRRYNGEIIHVVDERDGEIVGVCGMNISTDGDIKLGMLVTMYVKPEHRRKGIALGLLKKTIEIAFKKGVEVMFALTRHEATAATALYEKVGMEVNPQPMYYLAMFRPRPSNASSAA